MVMSPTQREHLGVIMSNSSCQFVVKTQGEIRRLTKVVCMPFHITMGSSLLTTLIIEVQSHVGKLVTFQDLYYQLINAIFKYKTLLSATTSFNNSII